tara:strand:+ start:2270 stop:2473 length:204 start_codon:yes stop_codon:yes gene_type:complete
MPNITMEQVIAMREAGFNNGMAGYPILWSDNGKLTVVSDYETELCIWEFNTDGSHSARWYKREGNNK